MIINISKFQAYKEFIVETAIVLTRETGDNVPVEEIRKSADAIYEFERELARVGRGFDSFFLNFCSYSLNQLDEVLNEIF